MEEKISVTLKAGTGFDVPWIVLKAASITELAQDLAEVQALFADVSYLAKAFEEAFKSAPASAAELVSNVLGGTQLTMEPPTPEYSAPAATPVAVAPAPWDVPAPAVAPMPWETGAPIAPPAADATSIKFPYIQKDETPGSAYMRRRSYMDWFYQNRNKLTFNARTKMHDFAGPLTPEQLAMARRAADVGGIFNG